MKNACLLACSTVLIMISSCSFFNSSKQESTISQAADGDSILIAKSFSDSLSQFNLEIRIPLVKNFEPAINDSINAQFTKAFSFTLAKGNHSFTEYAQAFSDSLFQEYRNLNADFPDHGSSYEWLMEAELLGVQDSYISGVSRIYSYSGGAHGGRSTNYFVINPKTGRQLSRTDLVIDTTQLNVLAEKLFRQKMELDPKADLSENGFWFDGNVFHLNENFAFSKSGKSLLFLFNEYEVTAYAAGQIELEIPLSQLNGILKIAKETNLQ